MASILRNMVRLLRIIAGGFQPHTRPWPDLADKPEWHQCVECTDATQLTGPSGAVRRPVAGWHDFASGRQRKRWSVVDLRT